MNKKEQADKFLTFINNNYERLTLKFKRYCSNKHIEFDEDIFSETYLRVYELIIKRGVTAQTEASIEDYLFKSFVTNIKREKQYARNSKRDVPVDNTVDELFEQYINRQSPTEKVKNDLWRDYLVLRTLEEVEYNFDNETYYLFKIKYLLGKTYKEVKEITKVSDCREKILTAKRWLQDNFDMKKVREDFEGEFQIE